MKPLLMTGFEPFLGMPANSSWDGLALMLKRYPDLEHQTAIARLPVTFGAADAALERALQEYQPRYLVSLGMHSGLESSWRALKGFYIEETGYNLDDAAVPDNAGVVRKGSPIEESGPEQRAATLPPEIPMDILARAGCDVYASRDPGRYLCNHVFYCGLMLATRLPRAPKVGFIHVPPADDLRAGALSLGAISDAYAALALGLLAHDRRSDA